MPFGDISCARSDHYADAVKSVRPSRKCLTASRLVADDAAQATAQEPSPEAALGQLSIILQDQDNANAPWVKALDLVHQCLQQTQAELFEAGVTVRSLDGAGATFCKAEMRWLLVGLLRTQVMAMAVHRLTARIDHAVVQGETMVRFQLQCQGTPRASSEADEDLALFDYIRGLAEVIGVRYDVRAMGSGVQHLILVTPHAA